MSDTGFYLELGSLVVTVARVLAMTARLFGDDPARLESYSS